MPVLPRMPGEERVDRTDHELYRICAGIRARPSGADMRGRLIMDLIEEVLELRVQRLDNMREAGRLQRWVADLPTGKYINCVYCGHRYGVDGETAAASVVGAPPDMAQALTEQALTEQALTEHVAVCPKHPMSALRVRVRELEELRGTRSLR